MPLLHHDADLLRQRRAAPRARVHDHRRRRARALPPPARRRHALPDRHRRARPEDRAHAPSAAKVTPRQLRRQDRRRLPRDLERARASPTTTSSAPPTPITKRRCRRCGARWRNAATSTWASTRAGTASAASASTPRRSCYRGEPVPDPQAAGRARQGEVVLLPAVGVHQAAARALRDAPRVHPADQPRATRCWPSSRRGCAICRSRAPPSPGASRCRIDPGHIVYVWIDALVQLLLGHPARRRGQAVLGRPVVADRAPDRQGDLALPRRLLAGVPHGRGLRLPTTDRSRTAGGPSTARRCRRRCGNVVDPLKLGQRRRRRRLPLLPAARGPARRRRRLHPRAAHRPLQRRAGQRSRQPVQPHARHGAQVRADARVGQRSVRRRRGDGSVRQGDGRLSAVQGAGSAVGAGARGQRLHRPEGAVEAGVAARRDPRQRARAVPRLVAPARTVHARAGAGAARAARRRRAERLAGVAARTASRPRRRRRCSRASTTTAKRSCSSAGGRTGRRRRRRPPSRSAPTGASASRSSARSTCASPAWSRPSRCRRRRSCSS